MVSYCIVIGPSTE